MGYTDNFEHMIISHTISRWTWNQRNYFFCLLNLTTVNSYTILATCGAKLSHRLFRLTLVGDLIQDVGKVP